MITNNYIGISPLAERVLTINGGKVEHTGEEVRISFPPGSQVEFNGETNRHRVLVPEIFGTFIITQGGIILLGYPIEDRMPL